MEFWVSYSALFYFIFNGFEWFWMGSLHKNIQLMLEFLKTILGPTLVLLYINDLDDVICNIAVYADTIISIRPGGEWTRCDQMGQLDKYTFLESADNVNNGQKIVFITFEATSFLQQFSKGSKKHITVLVYWIYWYIQLLVSTYFITVCSVKSWFWIGIWIF